MYSTKKVYPAFPTRVSGIPCQCTVLLYTPATSWPTDPFEEPQEAVFEYRILDRKGYLAPWLERKLTKADTSRLLMEYHNHICAL